jgi:hypothetical protein
MTMNIVNCFALIRDGRIGGNAAAFCCDSHTVRALHGSGRQASSRSYFYE